jgi:DNA-binding response OmpR family regulator
MLDADASLMNAENSLKIKILLAEDDASMRRFLEITLQRAGFEVVSAEDGLAAMKIALTEKFDAVIADAMMPNLTGHDLCRMLSQNSDYRTVPLIILSGMAHDVSSNIEQNCADLYLVKGADLKDELIEHLTKLISVKNEN